MHKNSKFSHILANTFLFSVYQVAILMGVEWCLTVVLICIPLILLTLSIFSRAYCISSLEMSIQVLCSFFNWIVSFYCCWVVGVLYIFWILIPNQIYHLQVFSLIPSLPFYSVIVRFDAQKFLILIKSSLSVFSFVACAFGVIYKKHCQNQCHEVLVYVFF